MQISAIFLCWVLNLTLTDNIRLIGSHILAREKVVPYRNRQLVREDLHLKSTYSLHMHEVTLSNKNEDSTFRHAESF